MTHVKLENSLLSGFPHCHGVTPSPCWSLPQPNPPITTTYRQISTISIGGMYFIIITPRPLRRHYPHTGHEPFNHTLPQKDGGWRADNGWNNSAPGPPGRRWGGRWAQEQGLPGTDNGLGQWLVGPGEMGTNRNVAGGKTK